MLISGNLSGKLNINIETTDQISFKTGGTFMNNSFGFLFIVIITIACLVGGCNLLFDHHPSGQGFLMEVELVFFFLWYIGWRDK